MIMAGDKLIVMLWLLVVVIAISIPLNTYIGYKKQIKQHELKLAEMKQRTSEMQLIGDQTIEALRCIGYTPKPIAGVRPSPPGKE